MELTESFVFFPQSVSSVLSLMACTGGPEALCPPHRTGLQPGRPSWPAVCVGFLSLVLSLGSAVFSYGGKTGTWHVSFR